MKILIHKTYILGCPKTFEKVGDMCLDIDMSWSSWEASKEECHALGGKLVQPHDLENLFAVLSSWPTIVEAEKSKFIDM